MLNPGLELYHDFYYYYVTQLAGLAKGLIPYKTLGYSYTPLFLFSLYPFFVLIGAQAASVPILLADAITAPLIFLIVERFSTRKIAIIAGGAYALSPFALLYEGYLWFSSQPMTFFIMLSMYFYFDKRPTYSAAALAIAVMFKQEARFIQPAYAIWYFKDFKKEAYKGLITFCVIVLAVSLPFLIMAPNGYVAAVSYLPIGHPNIPPLYPASTNNRTGAPQSVLTASHPLICSSISNASQSLVCNYGNFTYTDVKSVPPWTVVFSAAFLNTISLLIAIPLFLLVPYFLFRFRRNNNTLLLSSAYSSVAFIAAFALTIHPIYRYYLLPVYVLLLSASANRNALLASISTPILSLFLPSGQVQLLPPLFGMIAILMFNRESDPIVSNFLDDRRVLSSRIQAVPRSITKWRSTLFHDHLELPSKRMTRSHT